MARRRKPRAAGYPTYGMQTGNDPAAGYGEPPSFGSQDVLSQGPGGGGGGGGGGISINNINTAVAQAAGRDFFGSATVSPSIGGMMTSGMMTAQQMPGMMSGRSRPFRAY